MTVPTVPDAYVAVPPCMLPLDLPPSCSQSPQHSSQQNCHLDPESCIIQNTSHVARARHSSLGAQDKVPGPVAYLLETLKPGNFPWNAATVSVTNACKHRENVHMWHHIVPESRQLGGLQKVLLSLSMLCVSMGVSQ